MGGDGGCRVGEVRAGTTSPMLDHKGFKLQQLVNFQTVSTLRVNVKETVLFGSKAVHFLTVYARVLKDPPDIRDHICSVAAYN